MERIMNAPTHHAAAARFANGGFLIAPQQRFHGEVVSQSQAQFRGLLGRHLVEACQRGKRFGQGMGIGERRLGLLQRRTAGGRFRMLRQYRADKDTRAQKGHRS